MTMKTTNCEECINYFYDDDAECYTCAIDLDEDEMFLFMRGSFSACPYYRGGDDYTIVLKQI